MKKKRSVIIIVVVSVCVLILCCCITSVFLLVNRFKKDDVVLSTEENFNLTVLLEETGLENVFITEVDGKILEVRADSFASSDANETYAALLLAFDMINQKTSGQFHSIRIIFSISYVDSALFELDTKSISAWKDGKIDNQEIITRINRINLLEE